MRSKICAHRTCAKPVAPDRRLYCSAQCASKNLNQRWYNKHHKAKPRICSIEDCANEYQPKGNKKYCSKTCSALANTLSKKLANQKSNYFKTERGREISRRDKKKRNERTRLSYWINYYLPAHNYTGITRNFVTRKNRWKYAGAIVDQMRMIGSPSKTIEEAHVKENNYHQILGWRKDCRQLMKELKL